jgi:hypothetical protein
MDINIDMTVSMNMSLCMYICIKMEVNKDEHWSAHRMNMGVNIE